MMFAIGAAQFSKLTIAVQERQQAFLFARLRREMPRQVGGVADEELQKHVQDGYKAAAALLIEDIDHVYRFLRLRYLSASVLARSGAQELLLRVLMDTSVEAGSRLDFLENAMGIAQSQSGSRDT